MTLPQYEKRVGRKANSLPIPYIESRLPAGIVTLSAVRMPPADLGVPPFRAMIPTIIIGCAGWPPPILRFPACLFRRFDIPVFDGKIPCILRAADTTRRVGDDAEPLLAVLTPSANRAVLLFPPHERSLPQQPVPATMYGNPIVMQILSQED
jgi:hypothetical protein